MDTQTVLWVLPVNVRANYLEASFAWNGAGREDVDRQNSSANHTIPETTFYQTIQPAVDTSMPAIAPQGSQPSMNTQGPSPTAIEQLAREMVVQANSVAPRV